MTNCNGNGNGNGSSKGNRNRPAPPPNCGRRLLPAVIDERARDQPDRPWASIPIDDWDLSQGYEDVSYRQLAGAIDRLAWFIERAMGGRSATFETVAYLGVPDLRYHMMEMAVCKTGHKVLFSSQLNSRDVHLSLMRQTECAALFSAVGVRVDDILAGRPEMAHFLVPDLDDLLASSGTGDAAAAAQAKPYPYTKTYDEAKLDPYLILHSSGTTGDPKPVVLNHAVTASLDAHLALPDAHGLPHCLELSAVGDGVRFLTVTLPYHAMSAQYALNLSVFGGGVFVPGFRHRGVDAADIYAIIEHARVTAATLTPWMMEDIARRGDARRYIEGFDKVCFGGAALSDYAIGVWGRHTRIQNIWGATEVWAPPQLEGDNADAAYVHFDTVHGALALRPLEAAECFADDGAPVGLYEAVVVMRPDNAHLSAWHLRQGITPETAGPPPYPEYRSGDLWTPHPDPAKAAYAWRFAGRADDLLTFSTGINMHPAPMERAILADRRVVGALVVGTGRRQPLLLVELRQGEDGEQQDQAAVEASLWADVVEPQNAKIPVYACIMRSHILYVGPGGFVRTPKGSVNRAQTMRKYGDRIEETYRKFGDKWQDANQRFGSIVHTLDWKVEVSESGDSSSGVGGGGGGGGGEEQEQKS
ncbi:hypothetical protein SLS62_001239 [Diatrype stigma]|uniref:AMP-dependent synthetase/ligase domain-containing protein n=1 Tax=Diatrype stigma TaxID=117547 RepID=A0AAN9V0B9_9PEZI